MATKLCKILRPIINFEMIKKCKYLYIIACGSSYYAGLIASNYFRFTQAFECVNVIDGGEFTKAHLHYETGVDGRVF